MSYLYDRLNRRRNEPTPVELHEQEVPTVDDYTELLQAYRLLHTRYEQQNAELKTKLAELAGKEESLQRQGQDLKTREAELLFVKAALQQAESRSESRSEYKTEARDARVNNSKGDNSSNREDQNWHQKYEQLQTELEQLRKRWEQRFIVETTEVRNKILLDMLPFADHLDLAVQHAQSMRSEQAIAFIANIDTVRRAFLETLRRYGIERVDVLGEPFDPHRHEAVGNAPHKEIPADHVAQVVQVGYRDGERVLRPARVVVSTG